MTVWERNRKSDHLHQKNYQTGSKSIFWALLDEARLLGARLCQSMGKYSMLQESHVQICSPVVDVLITYGQEYILPRHALIDHDD